MPKTPKTFGQMIHNLRVLVLITLVVCLVAVSGVAVALGLVANDAATKRENVCSVFREAIPQAFGAYTDALVRASGGQATPEQLAEFEAIVAQELAKPLEACK